MSVDPERLLDREAGDLPDALRRGLSAAKADAGPDAAHMARLEEAFMRKLAAGAASTATPAEGVAKTGFPLAGKSAVVAAAAALGIAALVTFGARRDPLGARASGGSVTEAPRVHVVEPQTRALEITTVSSAPAFGEDTTPTVTPDSLANAPAEKAGKPDKPIGKGLAGTSAARSESEEIDLLGRAQESLRTRPASALALCQEHAARYQSGRYSQEREALTIEALVYLNRLSEAERHWEIFQSRYPTSSHRIHLQDLLSQARPPSP